MKTTFKQLLIMFASFFVLHSATVYLAYMFMPGTVALGTHVFSPLQALLQSVFIITLIMVGFTPAIEFLEERYQMKLKDMHWVLLYFVINAAAIWFVARFSEMLGFGISSWMVAVVLAVIFDLEQGLVMKNIITKMKAQK